MLAELNYFFLSKNKTLLTPNFTIDVNITPSSRILRSGVNVRNSELS